MARLGGHVAMAGRVGTDPFGTRLLEALRTNGVNIDLCVQDQEAASGVAFIFLTEHDNAIVVASGANASVGLDQEQYARILATLPQVRFLVLQLEIPLATVSQLITAAHKNGVQTILNLAPAQKLPLEILQKLSVLIVNESEASLLSGQQVESIDDATNVARQLHQSGIATVVITLGAQGAILVTGNKQGQSYSIHQPAIRVEPLDTTAAGDCFVGALTVALSEGQALADALRFATVASSIKVTRFGAQSGLPSRQEVMAQLQNTSNT
jgi:ribokinase